MHQTFKSKLGQDLLWNYVSLAILAVSGILINVIIATAYGSATLGVFNQVYAIYIMASQFGVGGVHYSVLRHVAHYENDLLKRSQIATSGLLLSFLLGSCISLITYLASPIVTVLLDSHEVEKSLILAVPALLFFSMNKVLLALLNGLRRMKVFAFGQATRYLLMIGSILVFTLLDMPGYILCLAFTLSEIFLFVILLVFVWPYFLPTSLNRLGIWIKRHFSFGLKGFMTGVMIEINSRVDVLMLGFFLSDWAVGIYSFAAMFAEGVYHILIVIRNNINPILVKLTTDKNIKELVLLIDKTRKIIYPAMFAVVILVIALFPVGVSIFIGDEDFLHSWPLIAILVSGIFISAGFIPFDNILIQAGFPGYQSLFYTLIVSTNILLNAFMIPILGIVGAAIATTISSHILMIVYLNLLSKRYLGFDVVLSKPIEKSKIHQTQIKEEN